MNKAIRKVKLVAIAKDEGFYLPEWIFHHFNFGFDCIDIYINDTSDNSREVIKKAAKQFDVNVIEADVYRDKAGSNFQQHIYNLALKTIDKQIYSHIAFLDIDEFWTPSDFNSNIKYFLKKNNKFDVSVFNWALHLDEGEFSPCFKENLSVVNNKHIKSVIKVSEGITPTVHTALGDLTYGDCDGNEVFSEHPGKAHNIIANNKRLAALVLHRSYRGPKEYVSLLGRGRPRGDLFKNNRFGYYSHMTPKYKLIIDKSKITDYYRTFSIFMADCGLNEEQVYSREFVHQRYKKVITLAKDCSNYNDIQSLIRALKGIEIKEVEQVRNLLKRKVLNNKVFQIGFNKCGTASLFLYMEGNGYKSIHWGEGKLSIAMQENSKKGKRLLEGYEDYQVFTDMEHRDSNDAAFYAYQAYFKELDEQYPGAIFILNTRNIDKWITSRIKHPGYLDKTMKSTGYNKEKVISLWKAHFIEHVKNVKSYFEGKSNFISFDLDNDDPEKLYNELTKRGFRLKNKTLPHTHKTKKNLSQKQKNVNALRDIALSFEKSDIETARDIMKIAGKLRPEGRLIQDKLVEYNNILKS